MVRQHVTTTRLAVWGGWGGPKRMVNFSSVLVKVAGLCTDVLEVNAVVGATEYLRLESEDGGWHFAVTSSFLRRFHFGNYPAWVSSVVSIVRSGRCSVDPGSESMDCRLVSLSGNR